MYPGQVLQSYSKKMIARFAFLVFMSLGCVRGTCFKSNIRWLSLSPDVMDIQRPIGSPYLCQGLCVDLDGCSAFTWTSEDNPDLRLGCVLFSATSNQTSCQGCVSGPASCTCSREEACVADDNFLVNIDGVLEEGQCQDLCVGFPSCMFYTWHDATSFYSYTCILLTSCDETEACSGCFTGPPECSSETPTSSTSTSTSSEIPTTTPAPATEGIILSGGNCESVEVFVPSTGLSCSLPDLPDERSTHTMESLLICGGLGSSTTLTTCLSFTSGQWITSNTLVENRSYHTSFQTEKGLVLMGGEWSPDTSEIVATAGGQVGPSFAMQYSTWSACSIPDLTSDSVIITGGVNNIAHSTVSRYGVLGWVEDMQSLVVGRYSHGCGSYFRGDSQVFLVAGGLDNNRNILSSTEVLTMDSSGWTLTTPLPRAVYNVMGVTMGGRLYMTGGDGGVSTSSYRYEIMGWLDDEQEWEETAKMKMARSNHAVSTIQMDDQAMEHCG